MSSSFHVSFFLACLLSSTAAVAHERIDERETGSASDRELAAKLLEEGRELLKAASYEEALRALERSVQLDPTLLEARMAHVTALRRSGRRDAARLRLAEAMQRFPEALQPVVAMGYLERAAGRLDESIRWFQRGADMPDGWYNNIRLAVSYADLDDLDRMQEAAERLSDSPYGAALGQTMNHLYRRQFSAGLRVVEAQLEESDDEMWLSFAATLAVLVGDDERALHHYRALAPTLFEEAPAVGTTNATDALWLGLVFKRTGNQLRAHRLASSALAALKAPPGRYELPLRKVYRAAANLLLGNQESALAELRAAVDDGYRSTLFERMVRLDEFEMFAPLHGHPEFRELMAEIRADNRRMLASLHSPTTAAGSLRQDQPG